MRGTTRAAAPKGAPAHHTVDLPPLCIRADVASVNDEKRTVELVFSTGAGVERYDYRTGAIYLEKLSLDPKHIRLDRLQSGAAPLLDAHSAWSISDQIGVVEPDSVRLTAKEARATVRFSKRATVEPIWGDVRDGILRNISVGYLVRKYEQESDKDGKPVSRTATDWEPFELSLVPMPADAGARVRSGDKSLANQCVIVNGFDDADRFRALRLARARS
jgi:hypothetical protein